MHLVASTTVENFKLEGDIIQLNFLLKMSKQINPEPMSSHTALLVSLGSCCLLGSQPVPSLLQGYMILQINSYIFFHRWWTSNLLPTSLTSSVAVVKASLEDAVGPPCRQWFPAILESGWCIIVTFRSAFHSSSSFQKIVLRLQRKLNLVLRFGRPLLSYLEVTSEILDPSASVWGSCFVPHCAVTFIDILLILVNTKP